MSARLRVRRAAAEDFETLFELITALAVYEKLEPPDEEARLRLLRDGFGEAPRYEAWLVEVDGEVAGYAIAFETYSTFLARPTLYIEDIFVRPEFRGLGAGYALFRHLAVQADERGCGRMEWVCLDWNRPAQAFYERVGARHLTEWLTYRLSREQLREVPEAIVRPELEAG